MIFRKCLHCGLEYESLFDSPTCSSKCAMEISWIHFADLKFALIVKEWVVRMGVTVTAIGIGIGKLVLVYRIITQETCPHDAKVKMAGFKDRYECTRCHKFIFYDQKLSLRRID